MKDELNLTPEEAGPYRSLVAPVDYGRMHAERGEIWQMRLLDASRFAKFAGDRGVRPGGGPRDGIERLWQVGWLGADLVKVAPDTSEDSLVDAAGEGFVEVGANEEDAYRLYADARTVIGGAPGRVGGAATLVDLPPQIQPLFHPFRYHVLHWLDGLLRLNITSLSTLTTSDPDSLAALTKRILAWKDERFGSPSFAEELREFNDRTAFAIVTEPLYYGRIFGHRTARTGYEPEDLSLTWEGYRDLGNEERRRLSLDLFERRVGEHKREVTALYEEVGLDRIESERKRLCDAAEFLDPNTSLQTLLRITRGEERLLLEGTTGGALLTLTMAEMLRRAAEDVFDVQLPEEDEMGVSILAPESRARIKERRYGSRRVLDDRETQREFVRLQGLDFGPRVRWYVEGATERGALAEVFGERGEEGAVLVDLRAQFGRKKNKIDEMRFGESLRQDIDAGVFSYVSLDSDDEDTLRMMRTTAGNDRFFGPFFAARPDFELGNFTTAELGNVLWRKATEEGAPDSAREKLLSAVSDAKSGKQLFEKAHEALSDYLGWFEKGEEWGRRLMAYALEHPEMEGKRRPIIDAIEAAFSSLDANYQRTRNTHRVDPQSGRLLPTVPDVTGKEAEEAIALLKERGLLGVEPSEEPKGSESALAETVPAAGALVEPGTEIRLLRADGPSENG